MAGAESATVFPGKGKAKVRPIEPPPRRPVLLLLQRGARRAPDLNGTNPGAPDPVARRSFAPDPDEAGRALHCRLPVVSSASFMSVLPPGTQAGHLLQVPGGIWRTWGLLTHTNSKYVNVTSLLFGGP